MGRPRGDQCRRRNLRLRARCLFRHAFFAAHRGLEFAQLLVIDKQLLGQRPLVTQHIDQEPHRTQTVAELLKNAGTGAAGVDVVDQNLLDRVAHAQRRQRRLIHT